MDGLSAAASVAGVLSLAIQLAQSTRSLIDFLNTFTDAPNEVIRLRDLLQLIHAMSVGVQNAVECQRRLYNGVVPGAADIHKALGVCQGRLVVIRDRLNRIENVERGRTLVSRSWARFRFALEKDCILDLERKLNQALSILNVMLTTNLMHANTTSAIAVLNGLENLRVESQQSLTFTRQACDWPETARYLCQSPGKVGLVRTDTCTGNHTTKQSTQRTTTTALVASALRQIPGFGLLRVEKSTKHKRYRDANGVEVDTKISLSEYMAEFSFLPRFVRLMITRSDSRALTVRLSFGHNLTKKIFDSQVDSVICHDDMRGLQRLLSKGVCTLDSAFGDWSLVEWASLFGARNIASFLYWQGCIIRPKVANFAIWGVLEAEDIHAAELFSLVCSKLDLFEYDPFDIILHPGDSRRHSIPAVTQLLNAIEYLRRAASRDRLVCLHGYFGALLCLLCAWWEPLATAQLQEPRDDLAKRLIEDGAGVHHVDRNGRTPLENLVSCCLSHDISAAVLGWQRLLEACQVDLGVYIREEQKIHHLGLKWPSNKSTCSLFWYHCIPTRIVRFSPQTKTIDLRREHPPTSSDAAFLNEMDFASQAIHAGTYCGPVVGHLAKVSVSRIESYDRNNRSIRGLMLCVLRFESGTVHDRETDREKDALNAYSNFLLRLSRYPTLLCNCDLSGCYLDLWPLYGGTHTMCQTGNMLGEDCLGSDENKWCNVHRCRFNHARFARKQEKKAAKQRRRDGIKPIKTVMPGSWVN
ncbi:hypothetical protein GQ53DRAFT_826667 [Thozetella sp. PMI_491]|nr:hypothetical protein GQ53DRAFT_826667 [Thozetella sp. PMI_491]